jgi:hypothetical protein
VFFCQSREGSIDLAFVRGIQDTKAPHLKRALPRAVLSFLAR